MIVELLAVVPVLGALLPVGDAPGPACVVTRGGPVPLRRASGELVCGWAWVEVDSLVALAGAGPGDDALTVARWRLTAAAGQAIEFGPRFDFTAARGTALINWDTLAGTAAAGRVEILGGPVALGVDAVCPMTAAGLVQGGAWSVVGGQVVNESGGVVRLVSVSGKALVVKKMGPWLWLLFEKKRADRGLKDFAHIEEARRRAENSGRALGDVAAVVMETALMKKCGWLNGY